MLEALASDPHDRTTGGGGAHNVVATHGTFDSGEPVDEAGTRFEFTFDQPGT